MHGRWGTLALPVGSRVVFVYVLIPKQGCDATPSIHPCIHQALTNYDCVVSDLLRVPSIVVKGHMPDSHVQVLNEARLVRAHRARVASSCG